MTNFKHISLAAALVVSAFGSVSAPAFAGTHPTGDGGAVCKGSGSCLVLQLDCRAPTPMPPTRTAPSTASAARS